MRIPALVLAVFAVLTCAGHAADDIERFSVRLSSTGDSKVEVLKELREMGLGLREAKDIVEDTPRTLVQGVTKDIAEPMKSRLEKAGAKVDIIAANSGAASSDAPASVSPPPTEVKIERLDPASGPFYVRIDAGLRTLPSESAAETGKLDENDDIKVLGATPSTRLQPADNERWWKVERKTGESGFVLGKYLMSAEIKKEKENILAKITPLQDLMSKPMSAQGPHVRMISGMYAAGGCEKEPEKISMNGYVAKVEGEAAKAEFLEMLEPVRQKSQINENNRWLKNTMFLWIDGGSLYRTDLLNPGEIRKYSASMFKSKNYTGYKSEKYPNLTEVSFFQSKLVEGPDEDSKEFATIGFAKDAKMVSDSQRNLLTNVKFYNDGKVDGILFDRYRRCDSSVVPQIANTAFDTLLSNILLQPMASEKLKLIKD